MKIFNYISNLFKAAEYKDAPTAAPQGITRTVYQHRVWEYNIPVPPSRSMRKNILDVYLSPIK